MQHARTYRTICISDTHLGSKDAQAGLLNNFLKHHSCDTLFLVGDIIDGWKIQQKKWHWRQSHSNVVRRVLGMAKHGTNVVYVTGNHDEFLRPFVTHTFELGNIRIVNQAEYVGVNGLRYLITHGDIFDGISKAAPWLTLLGDKAYDFILWLNTHFNWWRHKMGFGYWSVSKFLKHRVKSAVSYIFEFEKNLVMYCKKRGFDGVICGHIHTPEIRHMDGIIYMNDGDWVENCTALVEHHDGRWEIVSWTQEQHMDPAAVVSITAQKDAASISTQNAA
jgi:UDP-2,3-diacylglucosamine pyrophosphatase LpxH